MYNSGLQKEEKGPVKRVSMRNAIPTQFMAALLE